MMGAVTKSSLSTHVKHEILEMIKKKGLKDNKLPPESELAESLGVSLSTLREALVLLRGEGVIDKIHGLGSFVHQSALEARMRIDLIADLEKLIEDGGYKAKREMRGSRIEIADEVERENLELDEQGKVFVFDRMYYADDKPAVYVSNKLSYKFLKREPSGEELNEPIYQIYWDFCQEKVVQSVFEFIPTAAGEREEELFGVEKGTPMISWKEIFYNLKDKPISYNTLVFNPRIIKLKMLRKW